MRAGSHRRPGSQPQASSRIAVVGSCNLDIVTYADRIPAPGETVIGRRLLQVPGGKGANQAVAAARAGAEVSFIGAVGDDGFGKLLATALQREGVITAGLRRVPLPTGTAHITIDSAGENAIVAVVGANAAVALSERDRAVITSTQALLLQLEIPLEIVVTAAALAHEAGARVILTPAPGPRLPAELSRLVDLLIPNESEALALTGASSGDQAAGLLLAEVPAVAVTLGARGCIYRERGGPSLLLPAFPVAAVDTTAAGDTFAGALAVALAEGRSVEAALRWAMAAAALSVQREGAIPSIPYRQEIDGFASAHAQARVPLMGLP